MDASPSTASTAAGFTEADLCEQVAATVADLQRGLPMRGGVTLASSLDRDLGLDSLGRVELLLRIERAAGVALPEDTLQTAETVADLWRAVQQGRPQGTAAPAAPAPAEAAAPASDASIGATTGLALRQARTLLQVLDAHRQAQPERTHIVVLADGGEIRISHRQLADGSDAIAAGLQPRQAVAIMLPTLVGLGSGCSAYAVRSAGQRRRQVSGRPRNNRPVRAASNPGLQPPRRVPAAIRRPGC
ncbi:MAG: hypothetical protein JNL87_20855 [Burkholderiaceae bacterium]|nr:hypothetical protein [Burkholderiaceae bacterium]